MRIEVVYDRKPGRVDGREPFPFDWEAYDADTYTGEPGEPVGFGPTMEAAVADLLTQFEEREA